MRAKRHEVSSKSPILCPWHRLREGRETSRTFCSKFLGRGHWMHHGKSPVQLHAPVMIPHVSTSFSRNESAPWDSGRVSSRLAPRQSRQSDSSSDYADSHFSRENTGQSIFVPLVARSWSIQKYNEDPDKKLRGHLDKVGSVKVVGRIRSLPLCTQSPRQRLE